jgi:hypothetical protein
MEQLILGIHLLQARLSVRAAIVSGAPTTSICSVVSDRDRHLFLMGTETAIGNSFNTRSDVYKILKSRRY